MKFDTYSGSGQPKGLSPVWIISWLVSRDFVRNFLPQVEHSNLRSPLQFISHIWTPVLVLKCLPQTQLETKDILFYLLQSNNN